MLIFLAYLAGGLCFATALLFVAWFLLVRKID